MKRFGIFKVVVVGLVFLLFGLVGIVLVEIL